MRIPRYEFTMRIIYISYIMLVALAAYISYNAFFGGLLSESNSGILGVVIGFFDLFIGVFGVILAIHLHLSSRPSEEELVAIATVTRDLFYRRIILSLIEREPLPHSDILQMLGNQIPHTNRRQFRHVVYRKLYELAILRYIRLDPFYNENARRWIARAHFFDRKTEEFFRKHRQLLGT